MGTRNEDQPPEHWAGSESLDPTPVWKQFALIGLFLFVGLVLVGVVAAFAVAPQLVKPPALVPGDRLVLPISDIPPLGSPPRRVGAPLVEDARSFWLARVSRTEVIAIRAYWAPRPGEAGCGVETGVGLAASRSGVSFGYLAPCGDRGALPTFDERGAPATGAERGLDRYLVSVSDDRVIVNLSRLIVAPERTSAPPTP